MQESSVESPMDSRPSSSRRRLSTASQQAFKVPLIPYNMGRFSVPSWIRDIVSKMLQVVPQRRAELIEVAAKVPKEFSGKDARPLMELAWLDYKSHVGPMAGLTDGGGDGERRSIFSLSGMSGWSGDTLTGLFSGRRRSMMGKGNSQFTEVEVGRGGPRRKSDWV